METEWRCINDEVFAASDSLNVGEFITTDSFNLYDAMSAIELMDPKMDPPGRAAQKLDLPALVASGALPMVKVLGSGNESGGVNLTLAQARTLSVGLLRREAAWCDGTSLAESIFTCLYLHEPLLPCLARACGGGDAAIAAESDVGTSSSELSTTEASKRATPSQEAAAIAAPDGLALRAWAALAVGTLKTVSCTREAVFRGDIYEEDDFSPNLYDFNLCVASAKSKESQEVTSPQILAALTSVEADLRIAANTSSQDSGNGAFILAEMCALRRSLLLSTMLLSTLEEDSENVSDAHDLVKLTEEEGEEEEDDEAAAAGAGAKASASESESAREALAGAATALAGADVGRAQATKLMTLLVHSTGGSLTAAQAMAALQEAVSELRASAQACVEAQEQHQAKQPQEDDGSSTTEKGKEDSANDKKAKDALALAEVCAKAAGGLVAQPTAAEIARYKRALKRQRAVEAAQRADLLSRVDQAAAHARAGSAAVIALSKLIAPLETEAGAPSSEDHVQEESSTDKFGFDSAVTRHLLGSAPPRTIKYPSSTDALESSNAILSGLSHVCTCLQAPSLRALRLALVAFPHGPYYGPSVAVADTTNATAAAAAGATGGAAGDAPLKPTPVPKGAPPTVLPRSLMASSLYMRERLLGQFDLGDAVRGSMAQDGVPSVVLGFDPCVSLVERSVKAAFDSLHLLCLAPARQRLRCEASIKDWGNVQSEAHQVDCAFMAAAGLDPERTVRYATEWATLEGVWLMGRYIKLGIVTELFTADEIDPIYWYWSYLLSVGLHLRSRLSEAREGLMQQKAQLDKAAAAAEQARLLDEQQAAEQQQAVVARSGGGKAKGKKGKKNGGGNAASGNGSCSGSGSELAVGAEKAAQVAAAAGAVIGLGESDSVDRGGSRPSLLVRFDQGVYDYEEKGMELDMIMARGCLRLLVGFRLAGARVASDWQFTTRAHVFARRFACFAAVLQPAVLTLDHYQEQYALEGVKPEVLLKSAAECFRDAKTVADANLALHASHANTKDDVNDVNSCGLAPLGPGAEDVISRLRAIKKVAVANGVAVEMLLRGGDVSAAATTALGAPRGVLLDHALSPLYPVVKLGRR